MLLRRFESPGGLFMSVFLGEAAWWQRGGERLYRERYWFKCNGIPSFA